MSSAAIRTAGAAGSIASGSDPSIPRVTSCRTPETDRPYAPIHLRLRTRDWETRRRGRGHADRPAGAGARALGRVRPRRLRRGAPSWSAPTSSGARSARATGEDVWGESGRRHAERVAPVLHALETHGSCVLARGSLRTFREGGFVDVQPSWAYFFRERAAACACVGYVEPRRGAAGDRGVQRGGVSSRIRSSSSSGSPRPSRLRRQHVELPLRSLDDGAQAAEAALQQRLVLGDAVAVDAQPPQRLAAQRRDQVVAGPLRSLARSRTWRRRGRSRRRRAAAARRRPSGRRRSFGHR